MACYNFTHARLKSGYIEGVRRPSVNKEGTTIELASLGIDDPVGHRLGTWGRGYRATRKCLAIVHVLKDLGDSMDASGFGDGFHEALYHW